ncbi:E3 ubiquitin-protein ligase SH3RF3 isoform X2 [Aricia agestis]|uniref:E3 ubiquitin-protein ligase SH3RF3 isoform X2 n=1 Tax=Aricia agestis TaxID=91739 RepID=UPI001C20A531|nr:E3 ubiquitin-protein ligase SH3RF3 isoform X2 [Aricia agestis]
MDEGLLNDLLECSVCLERLDTSSRVLPCQHTFCLKCLKVIVESHKELRCPECRVLVEAKVEELPPNVLLMRILEGMKNSAPKRIPGQRIRSGHPQAQSQQTSRSDGKIPPPHARALYDYVSKEPGDLSFKKGETIMLQKKLDSFWYHGECSGRTGMFPITYVQVVIPLPSPTALCKALYDFRMSAPDEDGCLAFDRGAIITVHRRVDENWAEGRLDQRVGIFPIAFVELNQAARQLMNNAPLNRPVPPLPELARAGHSEHRHHAQHPHRYQPMSLSTPPAGQGNYQNVATMSQSHPNFHGQALAPPLHHVAVSHGLVTTTAVPRTIIEPAHTKHSLDLINFAAHGKGTQTMSIQSVARISDNYDRIRSAKFDNYNSTVIQPKMESQSVRAHEQPNNSTASSDSSSSAASASPPAASSATSPNRSDTSASDSAEPSAPASPDADTQRAAALVSPNAQDEPESLDASLGVLSLNESSTATNTSLNVSLPPSGSPKLDASGGSSSQPAGDGQETANGPDPPRLDTPCSSKNAGRPSGPDSLLNFGLGLQAALSPSHGKDGGYTVSRTHREHHREREKRHSLTPSSHLQGNHTQNRHSAEILATSLLDHTSDSARQERSERAESSRERRRRRSRSNERPLPAAYVALYPYRPQKSDELELKKGGVYTVTERCRDGWYKGWCERAQRCGVFPGNYVAPLAPLAPVTPLPHRPKHDKTTSASAATKGAAPPDAPPRAPSPLTTPAQQLTYPWSSPMHTTPQQSAPRSEKSKEKSKAEKSSISSGVSLMKRLAAMKKCKSPPPVGYSMDNPVFDDGPGTSVMPHPVHVRSNEGPWQSHRKSQSLDVSAARRDRHHSQPVKERFRCIAPYPPNSEYELELKVDDIVMVVKKRGDGWYKGTLQRTGRTGLFPASFVQSCPD